MGDQKSFVTSGTERVSARVVGNWVTLQRTSSVVTLEFTEDFIVCVAQYGMQNDTGKIINLSFIYNY